MRYFMLHHRLISERYDGAAPNGYDAVMQEKLSPLGADFISARDALCNAEGCLTRVGSGTSDIIASDQVHLTEKGSEYLIASVIDRVLGRAAPAVKAR